MIPTSGETLYTVGAAPHWRTHTSLARTNWAFVLALLPTALVGAGTLALSPQVGSLGAMGRILQVLADELGVGAGALQLLGVLGMLALAAGLAVLVEYVCQVLMRQPYRIGDGHAALTGLLLALLAPAGVPLYVLFIGIVLAIFLGKQLFGGIGGYPMHPAVVGWLILLVSWPQHMYPVGAVSVAAPGPAAVGATLLGGLGLWAMGILRPQIALSVLGSVALFSLLFQARLAGTLLDQFLTGHAVLCAFFLATDSTSSPANRRAMWLYGGLIGFLIVLIRAYGVWPDAVPFAVMLGNVLNPLCDRWRPRVREVGHA